MRKIFNKINTFSLIVITTTLVFLVIAFINGTLSLSMTITICSFAFLVYIIFTKRFYLISPFVSIFALLLTLSTIPIYVYTVTNQDPVFTLSLLIVGFLMTLFLNNLVSMPQWHIKSGWIANLFSLISVYFFDTIILTNNLFQSEKIIGILNFLLYMFMSILYFSIKITTRQTNPSNMLKTDPSAPILNEIKQNDEQIEELIVNSEPCLKAVIDGVSYLLFFSKTPLIADYTKSRFKQFAFYLKLKEKYAYSWLYNMLLTSERKKCKFIYVFVNENNEMIVDNMKLKCPRSEKTTTFTKITFGINSKSQKFFANKFWNNNNNE